MVGTRGILAAHRWPTPAFALRMVLCCKFPKVAYVMGQDVAEIMKGFPLTLCRAAGYPV